MRAGWPGRLSVAACWLAHATLSACSPGPVADEPGRTPNVVLILVDDLRWDVLGYQGYPIATPAIDRLAAEGVRFENAFVTTSLCGPSRASFLTGAYPHVHGVTGNGIRLDHERVPTLAMLLQGAGYRTGMIGKWHLGPDDTPRPGYDRWVATKGQGSYLAPRLNVNGERRRVPGYSTDILTAEAVSFIHSERDGPFFLHLAYKAVHSPRLPAARHRNRFRDVDWPTRPNAQNPEAKLRQLDAETLMAVDEGVAAVVQALEMEGILDDTVIVFTSDNGYLFGEHGRTDKRVFFEESIRIPWIVRYPRLAAPGGAREQMILNIDFVPTVLELAGLAIPDHVQGRSLLPVLADAGAPWRSHWIYEYFRDAERPELSPSLVVRTSRYKYAVFPEGPDLLRTLPGTPTLFDLERDPYEMIDVANDPDYRTVRRELAAKLAAFMAAPDFRLPVLDRSVFESRVREIEEENVLFRRRLEAIYPNGWPPDSRP